MESEVRTREVSDSFRNVHCDLEKYNKAHWELFSGLDRVNVALCRTVQGRWRWGGDSGGGREFLNGLCQCELTKELSAQSGVLKKRACGVKVVCQLLCDKIHSFFSAAGRLQVTIVSLRRDSSIQLICSALVKGWHWSGLDKDCVEKTGEEIFTKAECTAPLLRLWWHLQRECSLNRSSELMDK